MKIKWKDFEFEIDSSKDIELFKQFASSFGIPLFEETLPKRIEVEASESKRRKRKKAGVVNLSIERLLNKFLKKNSDHPELAEFAKWLRDKGYSTSTIYSLVTIVHRYIIHSEERLGESYKVLEDAKKLWSEFLTTRGEKRWGQEENEYIELIKKNWGYDWFKLDYFILTSNMTRDEAKEFLDRLVEKGILTRKFQGGDWYYKIKEEKKGLEELFDDKDEEEEFDLKKSLFESRKVIEETLR